MWILLALISAVCLGFYDVFKKLSVRDNNVLLVLFLNTVFSTLLLSPVLIGNIASGTFGLGGTVHGHLMIMLKSVIVLSSWILGYYAIKNLPLTIQGPINASRPVMVLVGALLIFGERLNVIQWIGITIGFMSLFLISRAGSKEGISLRHSGWVWMSIGATVLGAVSALYDKYLMRFFLPTEVQAWFTFYQCVLMGIIVMAMGAGRGTRLIWRWSIPCISLFITIADMAYFYSLSYEGAMISIVSMIRRGAVVVSFLYGVFVLHEKNIRTKVADLALLLVSLALLVIGAL